MDGNWNRMRKLSIQSGSKGSKYIVCVYSRDWCANLKLDEKNI